MGQLTTAERRAARLRAATAILVLDRKSRLALAAALGLALRLDAPDLLTADAILVVAKVALGKVRAAGRVSALRLFAGDAITTTSSARIDDAAARSAAKALRRRWIDAVREARVGGLSSEEVARAGRVALLDYADVLATNEALAAASDEVASMARAASDAGLTVTLTWSAELDARTCERCEELDNEERMLPDEFDDLPPLHPRCRCHILSEAY